MKRWLWVSFALLAVLASATRAAAGVDQSLGGGGSVASASGYRLTGRIAAFGVPERPSTYGGNWILRVGFFASLAHLIGEPTTKASDLWLQLTQAAANVWRAAVAESTSDYEHDHDGKRAI